MSLIPQQLSRGVLNCSSLVRTAPLKSVSLNRTNYGRAASHLIPPEEMKVSHSASPGGMTLVRGGRDDEAEIYMDYQATTPTDPRVLEAMLPTFKHEFGNAHSRTHGFGWRAEALTEKGRSQIAHLIGASPKEIIFTSGATESNNLALKGVTEFIKRNREMNPGTTGTGKPHIITVQTEHKCVLSTAQHLEHEAGVDVTYLPVGQSGLIDMATLEAAIRPETFLISVMLVNNEIGVIQPLQKVCALAKKMSQAYDEKDPSHQRILVHSDGAQAAGKIPVDVNKLGVDLMSISGHKMYGPKGVGALYVRNKPYRVRLLPQIHGGGQERGLRSGTLPVSLVVGMGAAAELAENEMKATAAHEKLLSSVFVKSITDRLRGVILNGGDPSDMANTHFCGNANLSFDGVEGESLIMAMRNVAVSSGSACTSASLEPSYVLRALGVPEDLAHTSIRFGIGKFTTMQQVTKVADLIVETVTKLRDISPLWEAKESGDTKAVVWT